MLNFVQFINDNTSNLTVAKRKELLQDLAESFQYKTEIEDPSTGLLIPNPQNMSEFVNEKLTNYIKVRINNVRLERSIKSITIENINI
jgi:hypothetical protein